LRLKLLKSKLHSIRVTDLNINYEGSLSIDGELMELAGLIPYEWVEVYNISTGDRFSTYVIPDVRGKRRCILNGAAARRGAIGDPLIVAAYAFLKAGEAFNFSPHIVILDESNRVIQCKDVKK
jgi:aspartate 1-decarboxylase